MQLRRREGRALLSADCDQPRGRGHPHALGVPSGGTGWANISPGSILFGNGAGALATSSNLFWDNADSRLGIGTTSPATTLSLSGSAYLTGGLGIGVLNTSAGTVMASTSYGIAGDVILVHPLTPNPAHVSDSNIGLGHNALRSLVPISTTEYNTAIGVNAEANVIDLNHITAVGAYACEGLTTGSGSNNTCLGIDTMRGVVSGVQNVVVGEHAGTNGSALDGTGTVTAATYVGYQAGFSAGGSQNTAIGFNAVGGLSAAPVTGNFNTGLGASSLSHLQTTSLGNTAVGAGALNTQTVGNYNIALGYNAGFDITAGAKNVIIGQEITTGGGITSGADNILIGDGVNAGLSQTGSNQLNIGNLIFGTALGTGSSVSPGKVGVGTSTPYARFSIAGSAGGSANLFAISTSTASFATSTAFIVDKNGLVGIGTTTPSTALQVAGVITPNADNTSSLGNATYRWSSVFAANGTIQTSDARLKSNIADLGYGLPDLLKLRPVSFTWKAQPQQGTQLGFIAQEVQPIFPETVNVGDDAAHTLGITYTEFIPVIVRSIQDIAHISGAFRDNLTAWLGNTSNGIDQFFANVGNFHTVNTAELCVTDSTGKTCVTRSQLDALLAGQGVQAAAEQGSAAPSSDAPSTVASSTPAADTTTPTATSTPADTTSPDTPPADPDIPGPTPSATSSTSTPS